MRGVSQNIPPVHPVQPSSENRSRTVYLPKMHRATPQSRGHVTSSETMNDDQQFSCVDDDSGANLRNTHQTHQQIRSNDDAGSAALSRKSHRSSRVPTFQPESCSITSRHRQKPSLNQLESSRHITRSKSGETKVYKTEEPPSTAAVDLPPL